MFEPADKVVVAVSGGPDSIVLLHALKTLENKLCLKLCVAHMDHAVRKSSYRDLKFVENEAKKLGLQFYSKTLKRKDVEGKGSLEERLRNFRYDFLISVAKKIGAGIIALGHTKDDQSETVLMRILRGSGLYGLSAILPKLELKGCYVVRPLIEISRKQVEAYLKKHGIAYCFDETNKEMRFLRNKVRRHLIPLLEKKYNPGVKDVLSGIALSVGSDYRFLSEIADEFIDNYMKRRGRLLIIPLGPLIKLDIAIRRIVLRNAVAFYRPVGLDFGHLEELEDLLFNRPERAEVHLPLGVLAAKRGNYLEIIPR